jgi:hypothetical protein
MEHGVSRPTACEPADRGGGRVAFPAVVGVLSYPQWRLEAVAEVPPDPSNRYSFVTAEKLFGAASPAACDALKMSPEVGS